MTGTPGAREALAWASQSTPPTLTIGMSCISFYKTQHWCCDSDLETYRLTSPTATWTCQPQYCSLELSIQTSANWLAPSPTLVSVYIPWSQGRGVDLTATLWCPGGWWHLQSLRLASLLTPHFRTFSFEWDFLSPLHHFLFSLLWNPRPVWTILLTAHSGTGLSSDHNAMLEVLVIWPSCCLVINISSEYC